MSWETNNTWQNNEIYKLIQALSFQYGKIAFDSQKNCIHLYILISIYSDTTDNTELA